jgi:hypothetical protein
MKSVRKSVFAFIVIGSVVLMGCSNIANQANGSTSETPGPTPSVSSQSTPVPTSTPYGAPIPANSPSPSPSPIALMITSPIQGAIGLSENVTVSGTYTGSPTSIWVNVGESVPVVANLNPGSSFSAVVDTTGLTNDEAKTICAFVPGTVPQIFSSITAELNNVSAPAGGTPRGISGTIAYYSGVNDSINGNLIIWAQDTASGSIVKTVVVAVSGPLIYPYPYAIDGLPDSATYTIGAYIDMNSNGCNDPFEAVAASPPDVTISGSDVSGVGMVLKLGYSLAVLGSPSCGSTISGVVRFSGTYVGYPQSIMIYLGEGQRVVAQKWNGQWRADIDTAVLSNADVKAFGIQTGTDLGNLKFENWFTVQNENAPPAVSISGTVSMPSGLSAPSGVLRICVQGGYENEWITEQSFRVSAADFPFAYTQEGIPQNDGLTVYAFIDENNNHDFDGDEYLNLRSCTVLAENLDGIDLEMVEGGPW